jgi:hypothetical protein
MADAGLDQNSQFLAVSALGRQLPLRNEQMPAVARLVFESKSSRLWQGGNN